MSEIPLIILKDSLKTENKDNWWCGLYSKLGHLGFTVSLSKQ